MFYTLEEAAEKLGVSEDEVRDMSNSGKLQPFRDRDKLMFKRDQVDGMASSGGSTMSGSSLSDSSGAIPLSDTDSGDTDTIDLSDSGSGDEEEKKEDPRQATGISVFDADEVDDADPMAQTQVTSSPQDEEELVLESVGSGSGLLDLTRESDDTSLGAELLDEIYPGGGEGSDEKMESAAGSSGVFDGAITMESSASGLENMAPGSEEPVGEAVSTAGTTVVVSGEPDDPAGSDMTTGFMLGTLAAIVIGLLVAIPAIVGAPSAVTRFMVANGEPTMYYIVMGGLLVACLVLGVIGFVVGKARGR